MSRHQAAKVRLGSRPAPQSVGCSGQETGSVEPGQMGGHKPKAVSVDRRGLAVATDQGRRFHHTGARCRACRTRPLKVDYHSVWDFVHARSSASKKRGGWRARRAWRRRASRHLAGHVANLLLPVTLRSPPPDGIWVPMVDMAEETTDGTTFSMAFTIDLPVGRYVVLSSGGIGQALNAPCLCADRNHRHRCGQSPSPRCKRSCGSRAYFPHLSLALTAPKYTWRRLSSAERSVLNSADCGLISKRETAVRAFE